MSKSQRKKSPKRVLALPDLEQAKSAVLNTLTSVSGQRTYEGCNLVEYIFNAVPVTNDAAFVKPTANLALPSHKGNF